MANKHYTLSPHPQGSPGWLLEIALTSTDMGILMKHNSYETMDRVINKFKTGTRVSLPSNYDMERGVRLEPDVRARFGVYLNTIWKNVTIREVGLARSIEYPFFGTSVDGLIYIDNIETDWCLEIKCPRRMYPDIEEYRERKEEGGVGGEKEEGDKEKREGGYGHIEPGHYDQMQWHCLVLGKKGCFYVVYVEDTSDLFIQYVPRDDPYIHTLVQAGLKFFQQLPTLMLESST